MSMVSPSTAVGRQCRNKMKKKPMYPLRSHRLHVSVLYEYFVRGNMHDGHIIKAKSTVYNTNHRSTASCGPPNHPPSGVTLHRSDLTALWRPSRTPVVSRFTPETRERARGIRPRLGERAPKHANAR
jgi:hypothetical protein